MNCKTGTLFVVATPIGNLDDLGQRAVTVLTRCTLILSEDTRQTAKLLSRYSIESTTLSFHEHNESERQAGVIQRLQSGQDIALVSDAGTPLISDPGYPLVRAARLAGIPVSPVPGPSAVIAALSVSGLATDRFAFEGFLPSRPAQRREKLKSLSGENRTLVFFESGHRILASLEDMAGQFGSDTECCVAREVSKKFESFYFGGLNSVLDEIGGDPAHVKGEFVVMVSAPGASQEGDLVQAMALVERLRDKMPLKQACKIAAETFALKANRLYSLAMDASDQ